MTQLTYLVDEICAGVEIYYSGRTGGQYLKTAFILCDDYSELMSKLYLLSENPAWSDRNDRGRFKNYHQVKNQTEALVRAKGTPDRDTIKAIHDRMKGRRDRRNKFFHSADLLDLSVTLRMCLEAFVDLFDYGSLLFDAAWTTAVTGARNLETYELLLRLERDSLSDPALTDKVMAILGQWPRNSSSARKLGIQIAAHPQDLHLRLAVTNGGAALRARLRPLLAGS